MLAEQTVVTSVLMNAAYHLASSELFITMQTLLVMNYNQEKYLMKLITANTVQNVLVPKPMPLGSKDVAGSSHFNRLMGSLKRNL